MHFVAALGRALRLVLDCNVLVAAARGSETCRLAVVRAIAEHEIAVSAPILAEYRDVCARPKHRAHQAVLSAMIDAVEAISVAVEPARMAFSLADPDDEVYLATAVASRAETLITGNLRHFSEARYGPVEILSPRASLDRTD